MALVPGLVRPTDDRMIAGVCSGIARYLKVDVGVVRVVVLLAVFLGGVTAWIYPIMWLLMPEEGSETAGADKLVAQAKQWNADRSSNQAPGKPQEVFNPYVDDPDVRN